MSSVLVTGGLGVNGSWVVRQLVGQGVDVVVYENRFDTSLTRDIMNKFKCVIGDILDLPAMIDTVKRYSVERIIHLAAVMPKQAIENPFMAFKVNVEGSINVLEAARLTSVKRIVFASSKSVLGQISNEYGHPTYKPVSEDFPVNPVDVYGATKLFVENMTSNYRRRYGLDCVCLRFSHIYGPGKLTRHGEHALTSNIIESAMLKRPLMIPQGRDQQEDMLYVKDVANSIILACFAENLKHSLFHIGTGRGETLQRMIEFLDRILPGVAIKIGPGLNYQGTKNSRYSIFNIERAQTELGYYPQYDLEKGVNDYIDSVKKLNVNIQTS